MGVKPLLGHQKIIGNRWEGNMCARQPRFLEEDFKQAKVIANNGRSFICS